MCNLRLFTSFLHALFLWNFIRNVVLSTGSCCSNRPQAVQLVICNGRQSKQRIRWSIFSLFFFDNVILLFFFLCTSFLDEKWWRLSTWTIDKETDRKNGRNKRNCSNGEKENIRQSTWPRLDRNKCYFATKDTIRAPMFYKNRMTIVHISLTCFTDCRLGFTCLKRKRRHIS